MVFKSLEKIYEPGQTPENVWEPVFQATQDKSEAVKNAEAKAHEARMAVGQLKETVAYCLKNDQSKQSPDLITMDENVARALYRYSPRILNVKCQLFSYCNIVLLLLFTVWKLLKLALKRHSRKPK